MARNMQPIMKRCRTLGITPTVMGIDKTSNRNPKPNRRKQSQYGMQLTEKQKVKFIYGVLEKQFRKYYDMATKRKGITGEMLLQILESRLDNVVFRLGLASTRREARQLVAHGHVLVNGKKVDIPSYLLKVGDVISIKAKSRDSVKIKTVLEANASRPIPAWLDLNRDNLEAKVLALPERDQISTPVEEHLIVELYSK